MASLHCLSTVMPLVLVLSGVILSVVIRRPLPHCHPPPCLLLLLLVLSLLLSVIIVLVIVNCRPPSAIIVVRHPLLPPSSSSLSHVLFDCCVYFCHPCVFFCRCPSLSPSSLSCRLARLTLFLCRPSLQSSRG